MCGRYSGSAEDHSRPCTTQCTYRTPAAGHRSEPRFHVASFNLISSPSPSTTTMLPPMPSIMMLGLCPTTTSSNYGPSRPSRRSAFCARHESTQALRGRCLNSSKHEPSCRENPVSRSCVQHVPAPSATASPNWSCHSCILEEVVTVAGFHHHQPQHGRQPALLLTRSYNSIAHAHTTCTCTCLEHS